jgi:uncharacterized membrane protein
MSDAFERAAAREQDEHRRRRDARRSAGNRRGLEIHLAAYVAVQLLLVAIWLLTGAGHPWFLYPLFGWGVGLVAHYAAVR